jgi:hypothetical protein
VPIDIEKPDQLGLSLIQTSTLGRVTIVIAMKFRNRIVGYNLLSFDGGSLIERIYI